MFGQFFLAGTLLAALHLAGRVFLTGNHISEKQLDEDFK